MTQVEGDKERSGSKGVLDEGEPMEIDSGGEEALNNNNDKPPLQVQLPLPLLDLMSNKGMDSDLHIKAMDSILLPQLLDQAMVSVDRLQVNPPNSLNHRRLDLRRNLDNFNLVEEVFINHQPLFLLTLQDSNLSPILNLKLNLKVFILQPDHQHIKIILQVHLQFMHLHLLQLQPISQIQFQLNLQLLQFQSFHLKDSFLLQS